MQLVRAAVNLFKSIEESGPVTIDEHVTVLVGMNEAGKTAFLEALHKSNSVLSNVKFNHIEDYPRRHLTAYMKEHEKSPAVVTTLTYRPSEDEIKAVNAARNTKLPMNFEFSVSHRYDNSSRTIGISVDEKPVVAALVKGLSTDAATASKGATNIRDLAKALDGVNRTPEDDAVKAKLDERIKATKWDSVVGHEVFETLEVV